MTILEWVQCTYTLYMVFVKALQTYMYIMYSKITPTVEMEGGGGEQLDDSLVKSVGRAQLQ